MPASLTNRLALGASVLLGALILGADGVRSTGAAFFCALTGTTPSASAAGAALPVRLPQVQSPGAPLPPVSANARWSDPATWGGRLPVTGDAVVIPAGKNVLLDIDPPALKSLEINGALLFDTRDTALTSGWIVVRGGMFIGSATKPFQNKATITLTASDPNESAANLGMGTRGILVMGGRLELYGSAPAVPWTQIADHAAAGAQTLKLKEAVGWQPGDRLVIAPTDFYDGDFIDTPQTEQLTLASASGTSLSVQTPLGRSRWGKLQYVTDSGMSLSPGTLTPPTNTAGKRVPSVLDERAEIGNLTRNIVIQGADDALWRDSGFGAQIMIMDRKANVQLDGLELRRVGQAGKFGRYPVHFHNLSYAADGTELGDVSYALRNSTISNSSQRCVVIHGSNGVRLQRNICYDIKGHAIFLEDAVERRNLIEGNLVLKVRRPVAPLLKHEGTEAFGGTSSGFWLVNPDNIVRGNVAADIVGHGYWLAYPSKPLGPNKNVKILPSNLPFGVFANNVAHSVNDNGVFLDAAPTSSDIGDTEGIKYIPTVGGAPNTYDNQLRFTVSGITVYKAGAYWGGGGGIWNRNSNPDYLEWVSADHMGAFFAGAGDNGNIERALVVAESLNNAIPRVSTQPLAAMASYHSTFDIKQNIIVGFPFVEKDNASAGAFRTDDYYITGVDKGLTRNPDNRLINTHPGRRVQPFTQENWTIAGALWDPHGYWGPKSNYWVYDTPFFTSGGTCQQVQPAGKNGASCDGQYYGVGDYLTDFDTNRYSFKAPIRVVRQDAAGTEIGRWEVGDGNTAPKLGNMRHFAARTGGQYLLTFPNNPLPKNVFMRIDNAYRSSDSFVMGVALDGSVDAVIGLGSHIRPRESYSMPDTDRNAPQRRKMVAKASLAEVRASDDGYWHDKANNIFWFKVKGGLVYNNQAEIDANPVSDAALYRPLWVEVFAKP